VESASVIAMRCRAVVLPVVLVVLGLPPALATVEAGRFYLRNRHNGAMVSSGERREYVLFVPRSYDRTRPAPLVISLHGAALWGAAQMEITRWNDAAEKHGFIVAYPSGVSGHGPRVWRAGIGADLMTDVRFIAELIDTLRASYHVDTTRIYANGLSNGGGMAFLLACALPDRIAAVGVVAPALFLPWSACPDRRAVPLIAFHGTGDAAIPYHGGSSWVAPASFPDIPKWVAAWAQRNRCAPSPVDTIVAPDVVRRTYARCVDGASVVFYTIIGGGHTWPGGEPLPEWFAGRTTASISATDRMWEFFRQHPLRAP
jgi:polyhydroxybutyrate depolymerase